MKLSEKLAAARAAEEKSARAKQQREKKPTRSKAKPKSSTKSSASKRSERSGATWSEAKKTVRELVRTDLAPKLSGPKALSGAALEKEVRAQLDRILRKEAVKVSPIERQRFVAEVISDTLGYGPLDGPLSDPTITEIMCNAHDAIFLERDGVIEESDLAFADEDQYRQVIDKIVSAVGRRVDESSPMVDARLPNGSRVNAIIPPLALRGAVLTIRKFAEDPFTASDLVELGAFPAEFVDVMDACVKGKLNLLISGGTGTGKTTLLNVLSSFIPERERILTIEDAAELQLQQPHVVNLEARPANAEGRGEVAIRDLVRNALRMRPDRIVVGEVRGPEALDMLQAMNTGHEGSLTTVHANSPRDALSRLETMVLMAGFELPVRAIREQIASAIHVIVQLERMTDGGRKVTSVQEVQGMEGDTILLQDVFRFSSGSLTPTGLRPRFIESITARGVEIPAALTGGGSGRPTTTAAAKRRRPGGARAGVVRRRR